MNIDESKDRNIVNPQKFVVWLLIVSVVMLFAALTSAYIVRRGEGSNWIAHDLPNFFTYSTVVVLLSSLTIHLSSFFHKKGDYSKTSLFISLTTLLGVTFSVMQVMGGYEHQWKQSSGASCSKLFQDDPNAPNMFPKQF